MKKKIFGFMLLIIMMLGLQGCAYELGYAAGEATHYATGIA